MKKKDTRKFYNMFKLSKHQKKINHYKEEFLEEYYYRQRKIKEKIECIIKNLSLKMLHKKGRNLYEIFSNGCFKS